MKKMGTMVGPPDRFKGMVVTFDVNLSGEDVARLRDAILSMKHVVDVAPVTDDYDDIINRERIRQELLSHLREAVHRWVPIR